MISQELSLQGCQIITVKINNSICYNVVDDLVCVMEASQQRHESLSVNETGKNIRILLPLFIVQLQEHLLRGKPFQHGCPGDGCGQHAEPKAVIVFPPQDNRNSSVFEMQLNIASSGISLTTFGPQSTLSGMTGAGFTFEARFLFSSSSFAFRAAACAARPSSRCDSSLIRSTSSANISNPSRL